MTRRAGSHTLMALGRGPGVSGGRPGVSGGRAGADGGRAAADRGRPGAAGHRPAASSRPRRAVFAAAVLILTLAVILPAPPVLAEESMVTFREHSFSDVSGSQAYYFDITGTAGIIRGDEGPGGPCRPFEPVTRAEFAVMVLRLLALDPSFAAPETTSPSFRDAADIPAWAREAASACAALGIVTGEPDGRGGYNFDPNDNVTGAEATAILLRALGNSESITGGWPAGYLFRAYETGLFSSDIAADDWRMIGALTPLTRAQMAYLLSNALFCSRGYRPGAPGREGVFSRSSIGGRMAGYSLIIDADLLMRSLTTADGRTLRLAGVVVAPGVKGSADLVGRRIFWLQGSRGQVGYILPYPREAAVTGDLAKLVLRENGQSVAAVHLADGRVIQCLPGAIIELNGQRWPFDPGTILPVATVTAITDHGQAVYVSIIQEDLPEAVIKTLVLDPTPAPAGGAVGGSGGAAAPASAEASPTTGRITARISMGEGDIPLVVTPDTQVYLNGQRADLSDLREWDVFYAATEGTVPKTALRLYAYRSRVTGTVADVIRVYDLTGFHWKVEVDDAEGRAVTLGFSSFCEDLVSTALQGQELTFCCNRLGEVTYFHAPAPAPGSPRVVKILRQVTVRGRRYLTVDWQGSELTYTLAPEVPSPALGTLIRIVADPDGSVARTEAVRPAFFEATVVTYDPVLGRLSLTRDQRTWSLNVRRVPVYAVTDINDQAKPGAAVPLESLTPGQTVWLEDPGCPGYILVQNSPS